MPSAATDHCYTPSWCKCPDEPRCLLCKQGRCPVEPETSAAGPKPIKCGQCQQSMTVDEFFSDDHPCLTDPEKTIDEAMREWNL